MDKNNTDNEQDTSKITKSSNKQNYSRKRKRKWNGFVPKTLSSEVSNVIVAGAVDTPSSSTSNSSSSERKLASASKRDNGNKITSDMSLEDIDNDLFIIIHLSVLKNICGELACPNCAGEVSISDDKLKRRGFAHSLNISCLQCGWMKSFYTSPETTTNKNTQGRRAFDVNTRAVIGFREIGCGFSAMETFSSVMNVKCLSSFPFKQLNKKAMIAYKSAAESSMEAAAKEVPKIDFVNDIILYARFN